MKNIEAKYIFLFFLSLCCLIALTRLILPGMNKQMPPPTSVSTIQSGPTDVGPFSLQLPKGWTYSSELSTSSQVGQFKGEGITILFDYGNFSNTLARELDPKYEIVSTTLDGRKAKIVRSKINGQGITGVYFENIALLATEKESTDSGSHDKKKTLEIHAENLSTTQQDTVLTIIKTIRFTQ